MINALYTDKKNIEFIGFQCGTCGTFGNLSQHKTIPPRFPTPCTSSNYTYIL